jgi:hypothetical protein
MSRRRKLPPIPSEIQTQLGPMAVRLVDRNDLPDPSWGGHYDQRHFCINIANDMAPRVQWHVFYHEEFHARCDLAGMLLPRKQEEGVCQLYATTRLAELLRGTE